MSVTNPNGNAVAADNDDHDSTFGDTQSSLTTSLTPSVFDFRYENGRRYHAFSEKTYPIPNDEIEKDRLDLQHHAFRLTLDGKLYRAPIRNDIQHVLDVGTGTGIWAIEFCDLHPSAQVVGTDLSPIQPEAVPPNCSFLIDDCEQEWLFHHPFDFIHTRALIAAVKDWPRFFEQAYDNLIPGGYLELQEILLPCMCMDTSLTADTSPLLRWSSLFIKGAAQIGVDVTMPLHFGPILHEIGFVDVNLKIYNWPVGQWAKGEKAKSLGNLALEDLLDGLSGGSLELFTKVMGWSRERVELFLAEVRRELKEHKERHFYAHIMMWYARKPMPGEQWNPAIDAFTIEDAMELEEDDEEMNWGITRASTPFAPLRSPSGLVMPTAGLSLATASITTTPIKGRPSPESKCDSASTIDTCCEHPIIRPESSPFLSYLAEDKGGLLTRTPDPSQVIYHTHNAANTSTVNPPKTTQKSRTETSPPSPLDIGSGTSLDSIQIGPESKPFETETACIKVDPKMKGKELIYSTVENEKGASAR